MRPLLPIEDKAMGVATVVVMVIAVRETSTAVRVVANRQVLQYMELVNPQTLGEVRIANRQMQEEMAVAAITVTRLPALAYERIVLGRP